MHPIQSNRPHCMHGELRRHGRRDRGGDSRHGGPATASWDRSLDAAAAAAAARYSDAVSFVTGYRFVQQITFPGVQHLSFDCNSSSWSELYSLSSCLQHHTNRCALPW